MKAFVNHFNRVKRILFARYSRKKRMEFYPPSFEILFFELQFAHQFHLVVIILFFGEHSGLLEIH